MKTYDVVFNDEMYSIQKGWNQTKNYCIEYIKSTMAQTRAILPITKEVSRPSNVTKLAR